MFLIKALIIFLASFNAKASQVSLNSSFSQANYNHETSIVSTNTIEHMIAIDSKSGESCKLDFINYDLLPSGLDELSFKSFETSELGLETCSEEIHHLAQQMMLQIVNLESDHLQFADAGISAGAMAYISVCGVFGLNHRNWLVEQNRRRRYGYYRREEPSALRQILSIACLPSVIIVQIFLGSE